MKMYVDFWEFYGKQGIRRAFCESKECKIWTFIVGVMVIRGIVFIRRQCGQHKKLLLIIFEKIKENCAMLDRSILQGKLWFIPFPLVK
jgi:hypothetical protein